MKAKAKLVRSDEERAAILRGREALRLALVAFDRRRRAARAAAFRGVREGGWNGKAYDAAAEVERALRAAGDVAAADEVRGMMIQADALHDMPGMGGMASMLRCFAEFRADIREPV